MKVISKQDLTKYTIYPKAEASSLLGLSVKELTTICKNYGNLSFISYLLGISKWPYHTKKEQTLSKDSLFQQFRLEKKSILLASGPKRLEKPWKTVEPKAKSTYKGSLKFILDFQVEEKEECWIQKFTFQMHQNSN